MVFKPSVANGNIGCSFMHAFEMHLFDSTHNRHNHNFITVIINVDLMHATGTDFYFLIKLMKYVDSTAELSQYNAGQVPIDVKKNRIDEMYARLNLICSSNDLANNPTTVSSADHRFMRKASIADCSDGNSNCQLVEAFNSKIVPYAALDFNWAYTTTSIGGSDINGGQNAIVLKF